MQNISFLLLKFFVFKVYFILFSAGRQDTREIQPKPQAGGGGDTGTGGVGYCRHTQVL